MQAWSPPLRLDIRGDRCRLVLVGVVYGNGHSLQEAADDLLARLLDVAQCFRTRGLRFSSEIGVPDQRVLEFVWEVGEIAARGHDIRERVFGAPADAASQSAA